MTCVWCGATVGEWWWRCADHDVWECDGCSYPYEHESHRFHCKRTELVQVKRGVAHVVAELEAE